MTGRGSITRRGKKSWRIKFDTGRDALTGERQTAYVTVKGTRREAQEELTRRLHALDSGTFVEPAKTTLAEWLDQWFVDQHSLAGKTRERYGELIAGQIKPHLGRFLVQKIRPAQIKAWHGTLLREGGAKGGPLAPRTVGHAHKVLAKALADAMRLELVPRNVAAAVPAPKVEARELEILSEVQIAAVTSSLRGLPIYPVAALALASGMRRGELLALRWSDVDFDGGKVRVERSLEETAKGLRFKPPKTKHGRRAISLPASALEMLRDHRRAHLEWRLRHAMGKLPDDALVFPGADDAPRAPSGLTREWRQVVTAKGLPRVSFHALRHSHASMLIAASVDVLTVSRRLGHGSPSITLGVYAHLFSNTDDRAASAIDATLGELS